MPTTDQSGQTNADEVSCIANRKACFCQGCTAIIKCHNDPFFGFLPVTRKTAWDFVFQQDT